MNKVIILLGQRVRSGTNFIGSTLAQHPDVVTFPKHTSFGEFNLFKDCLIETVYSKVTKESFGLNFNSLDRNLFFNYYGNAWLQTMLKKYDVHPNKVLFIKSPSVKFIALWEIAFPNSRIAIIYRDGRDNVISCVKASNDKRSWHTPLIQFRKKLNYYSGRSFINHVKNWVETSEQVLKIKESERITKFKYEELNNNKENIEKLLNHFKLKCDKRILEKCMEAPVVGSSFGLETPSISKPNWCPDNNKSNYVFSNRWKSWSYVRKKVFDLIAGEMLVKMGYERSSNL